MPAIQTIRIRIPDEAWGTPCGSIYRADHYSDPPARRDYPGPWRLRTLRIPTSALLAILHRRPGNTSRTEGLFFPRWRILGLPAYPGPSGLSQCGCPEESVRDDH